MFSIDVSFVSAFRFGLKKNPQLSERLLAHSSGKTHGDHILPHCGQTTSSPNPIITYVKSHFILDLTIPKSISKKCRKVANSGSKEFLSLHWCSEIAPWGL